jgi:membrane peptidoglycan carboxypeptidase
MTRSEYLKAEIKDALMVHYGACITPELKEEIQSKVEAVVKNYKDLYIGADPNLAATVQFDLESGEIIIKF